jgi:predicted nuclease with TOPRIM domain
VLEVFGLLSGLSVGDSGTESMEGTMAELKRLVDRIQKGEILKFRKAFENVVPVVARADVAGLAIEDTAKLRGLNGRDNEKILALASNPPESGDDVVGVNTINLTCDHDAVEEFRIRNRLLSLPIR